FPDAGRTGDVDFRQVVANHVQAHEQQASRTQVRTDDGGDLAIAIAQRARFATAARSQVATRLAGRRYARQAVRHRLTVDHQDAFIARLDFGDVTLRHDLPRTVVGQRLENHRQVGIAFAVAKDRGAAHLIQGFENDVTVLAGELAENV